MQVNTSPRAVTATNPLALLLIMLFLFPPVARAQQDAPIAGIPKGWLIPMRKQAGHYVNFAKASFTLDEGQVGLLMNELDNRISDQWMAEQELVNNPPALPQDDSPAEARRYAEALQDAYEAMPMNAQKVLDWIVDVLADPKEVVEGRMRFTELCFRLDRENKARSEGPAERVALGQLIKQGRGRMAFVSRDGLIDPSGHVKKDSAPTGVLVTVSDEHNSSTSVGVPTDAGLPAPLPCMKQFEMWSSDGGLTADDRHKLFDMFHFRTWRVLAADPDLYRRAVETVSDTEISDLLQAAGLDHELAALMHELKLRINVDRR